MRAWRFGVVMWALLASSVARADEPRMQEAKRLRDAGAEALHRGDFAAALARFQEARRAYPSPRLLFNLGLAFDGLHQSAEALDAFESFLRGAPDAPDAARTYAQRRGEQLRAELAAAAPKPVEPPQLDARTPPPAVAPPVIAPPVIAPPVIAPPVVAAPVVARVAIVAPALIAASPARAPRRPLTRRWWFWTGLAAGVVTIAVATTVAVTATRDSLPSSSLGVWKPTF